VKPFLLLASRSEDVAADDEYAGFLSSTGLTAAQLHRVRLESEPMPPIDLDEYSGIIVGGSPFNAGDPEDSKSDVQRRVEAEFDDLIDRVMERDYPFFGACYGVGLLTRHLGGIVDRTWPEEVGPTRVTLTEAGLADPVFGSMTPSFDAFVGHKEACSELPPGAVLLASGEVCPVQAFRVGANVFATQFHPELTNEGIVTRIRIYRDNGYFDPNTVDDVIASARASVVTEPAALMAAFVRQYS
jgi:GMP synthase (glutamine-hydrolysing)